MNNIKCQKSCHFSFKIVMKHLELQRLFQFGYRKVRRLFEARRLLEEIR